MPWEVEPRPFAPAERFGAPEEAQEASYLAASARMRSFLANVSSMIDKRLCSCLVLKFQDRQAAATAGGARKSPPLDDAGRVRAVAGSTVDAGRRESDRARRGGDARPASWRARGLARISHTGVGDEH